ncbi:hypothetical protein EDB86DRAFT_2830189 [Lactarius hatsudake]|nr:hypothetical protein EDB86DRAFT_2830189 [Lactarius hatsudake]
MSPAVIAPPYLWDWYIDYLWNYDHDSWVATIAYGFRVWAILSILPTVILCLLDVTSYVIARTLGDPTASTYSQIHTSPIPISPTPPPSHRPRRPKERPPPPWVPSPTKPTATATYFVGGEADDDGAARLAGVGVFTPVASMPGSPMLSRRRSFPREEEGDRIVPSSPEHGHERTASGSSGAYGGGESTSGESSFTLLERAESFEEPAAAHIRRRIPGPAGAADD